MIVDSRYCHIYGGTAYEGNVSRAAAERIARGPIGTDYTGKAFDDGRHPVETLIYVNRGPRGGIKYRVCYIYFGSYTDERRAFFDSCFDRQ